MSMRTRSIALACTLAVLGGLFVSTAEARAQTTPTGTLQNVAFQLTRFVVQNGRLAAVGTLTGQLVNAAGDVVGNISQVVTIPVSALQVQGQCEILHLELGPLDLNLLGLMVHLDKVVLDITAQSGPGNLLGNLLCAVAHLLDNGNLNGLVGLLNNILRHL